jgi:hypothetical protein
MSRPHDCRFVFLLKTYAGDVDYVERLLLSFHAYNIERLQLVITCPARDRGLFDRFAGDTVFVMNDEDVTDQLVDSEVAGIRPGYINQEIIKLAFWETGIARNYMCLDSDGVFLRSFGLSEFMFDAETPYTVMFEDNELRTDTDYYETHWLARKDALDRIRIEVGLPPQPILTCHGFGIFSARVLSVFREEFMTPRKLTYADLLAISPFEYSWYTLFLQARNVIDIHPRESLFRYVHTPRQFYLMTLSGTTAGDLSRGYVGVTVNSNFSRDFGLAETGEPLHDVLARYVSFKDLGRAVAARVALGVRVMAAKTLGKNVG